MHMLKAPCVSHLTFVLLTQNKFVHVVCCEICLRVVLQICESVTFMNLETSNELCLNLFYNLICVLGAFPPCTWIWISQDETSSGNRASSNGGSNNIYLSMLCLRYKPPSTDTNPTLEDPTPDYMNLLGMIFSMCGLMLKVSSPYTRTPVWHWTWCIALLPWTEIIFALPARWQIYLYWVCMSICRRSESESHGC